MTSGHLGEWVAAHVCDIELEASAVAAGIDGRFRSGPLQDCAVNIKWYLKREGLLDTTDSTVLDYYLVLTGPPSSAGSSLGGIRHGVSRRCSCLMRGSFAPSRSRGSEDGRCLRHD